MSEGLKAKLRGKCGLADKHLGPFDPGATALSSEDCWGCSSAHCNEFEDSIGVVEGPVQEGSPEVNVRWEPDNLRYGYHPDDLDVVSPKRFWTKLLVVQVITWIVIGLVMAPMFLIRDLFTSSVMGVLTAFPFITVLCISAHIQYRLGRRP